VLSGGEETAKVLFPVASRRDHGHALFHRAAADASPIACASCHPEGGDDGRVWKFDVGLRRTQNVAGGVLSTMPLHWDGDLDTLHEFVGEVFVTRMGGAEQSTDVIDELGTWLDALPAVPSSSWSDADAVARGEALFNDATVACSSCHAGGRTNNQTVDVGTGKPFQVPSLTGVANRPPYMHDGCAPTLRARFDDPACGGGDAHGKTSQLSEAQLGDLIAYLETL
jgi:cytochrome c peroxidase